MRVAILRGDPPPTSLRLEKTFKNPSGTKCERELRDA